MKKIFSFAAALLAAMTINAQETITCAQATQLMPPQQNAETEDEYIIVGYVTKLVSNPSPKDGVMQQRFWMDDNKGSAETVNCYWCNLPEGYIETGLSVGDKISVQGKIINYNNKPELKNAPITMLEPSSVIIETYDVDACEAIEEGSSLNPGDMSTDIFRVHGRLKGPDAINSAGKHTFDMACGEEIFQAYSCTAPEGVELGKGDSVVVVGKLLYYNGEKVEINGGSIELIEKSQEEEIILEIGVAEAVDIAMALEAGKSTEDRYAVTGYVDSIAEAFNEQYQNISFFMTDDMADPAYNFEAFRVKCTAEEAEKIVVGAKVTVTAALQHYYKDATAEADAIDLAETVAGGILSFPEEQGIESIVLTEKAQKVVVDGVVYIIRDNKMFNTLGTQVK